MAKQSLLILYAMLILFILLIQLQNPGKSISGEVATTEGGAGNAISRQSSGNAVIGQVQTRDKVIIIRSGADGQLYTVKSRDGNLLAVDLNAEELDAKFPELKKVLENGLAGHDATLRMNNRLDLKVHVQEGLEK